MRQSAGAGVEVIVRASPRPAVAEVDVNQIELALLNLVVNARDAMPGGGTITIDIGETTVGNAEPTLKPGRYVELTVSDTGHGMDQETQSHIFEPFFTTKEKGKGTGLGLATVYAIVQQSGGVIEVESQLGKGTSFRISLPQVVAVLVGIETPAPMIGPTRGAETVLLVEDEGSIRELVGSMLRKVGYTVLEASDGEEALELAKNHEGAIHLVLTDVVMPGIDGCVLAERLTAVRSGTRVLYMSGYACDLKLRLEIDAAHFLQKPFSRQTLVTKVCEVLTVGEGLETMLSLRSVLPEMPMLAGLSANHLAALKLPFGLRRLYVARDNDAEGRRAETRLRERIQSQGVDAALCSRPMRT